MKSTMKLMGLLFISVIFLGACNEAEKEAEEMVDEDQVRSEIQAMEDAYAEAEQAKDAEAVAAYYAEDAISYTRNRPPLKGRDAIAANIAKNIAADTSGNHNVYKIVDLFIHDDAAVEVGSWTEMTPEGEAVDNGYYMSYFEKRDGKYICVRDMSTTTSEAKPAME